MLTLFAQGLRALNPPLSVNNYQYKNLVNFVREKAENKEVAVLSTRFYPTVLLEHDADIVWITHYPNFWSLPGFYNNVDFQLEPFPYHHPLEMNTYEKDFFYTTVEDLYLKRPKLILISTGRIKSGFGFTSFDFYTYFSQDPRFAQLMSRYELSEKKFDYDIYMIKERQL